MKYSRKDIFMINNYEFEHTGYYLILRSGPKVKGHYHEDVNIFFESLGISREIFCKKFNLDPNDGIFPPFSSNIGDEVIDYLLSFKDNPQEITYEIY